jgi:hypothetical protein
MFMAGDRVPPLFCIRLTGYVQPEVEVIRTLRLGSFWCLIPTFIRADVRLVVGKAQAGEMLHATRTGTSDSDPGRG